MRTGRVVGIIVARMGSTRVPGKSVLELCGKPLLWHIIQNTKRAKLDGLCLATSTLPQDDPLASIAADCGVDCVRGDPERVLDRVYPAAVRCKADVVVDVGGDCPFIYPRHLDDAVACFMNSDCDYLCNYEPPTFPEGFDINILTMDALTAAYELALAPSQRIHPFSYLTRHSSDFRIQNYTMAPDLSHLHWSVDFPEDVAFVRAVYERLYTPGQPIELPQILDLIEHDSEIAQLNERLIRPKVLHAFWNSPGMMRDMNQDLSELARIGQEAVVQMDFGKAVRCYDEILSIAAELRRHAEHGKSAS